MCHLGVTLAGTKGAPWTFFAVFVRKNAAGAQALRHRYQRVPFVPQWAAELASSQEYSVNLSFSV